MTIGYVKLAEEQFLSSFHRRKPAVEPKQERAPKDWLNPPSTVHAVLCYINRGDEYLLLLKSKGKFGEGFWNAPGGKVEPGETPQQAAKREVLEETGLSIVDARYAGYLEFYFGPGKKEPDWIAQVFKTSSFSGEMKQSEEGVLRWFNKWNIPYEHMWEDDRHWLPLLILGKKFSGTFEFTPDSKKIVKFNVVRLSSL